MLKGFTKEELLKKWISQRDDLEVAALEGGMTTEIGITGGGAAAEAGAGVRARAGAEGGTETGITAAVALAVALALAVVVVVLLLVTTSAVASIVNHQLSGV